MTFKNVMKLSKIDKLGYGNCETKLSFYLFCDRSQFLILRIVKTKKN